MTKNTSQEIKLNILYSVERDATRIKWTLEKINWYKENGYKPAFPKDFPSENPEKLTYSEIKSYVEKEFNESYYENIKEKLAKSSEIYLPILEDGLIKLSLPIQEIYNVSLTKYGTGGSYHPPNTIILNITNKYGIGPIKTVVHEIIHLSTQHLIDKYKVSHWKKERLVDTLFLKLVPQLNPKMQEIKDDVSSVDMAFEKNYPDIEKICSNI